MKNRTTYILIIVIISICSSCNSGKNEQSTEDVIKVQIDTISCGNNMGLIESHFFNDNREILSLPINDTFIAIYSFGGNFKNILEKGDFNIELLDDSLSTVTKIGQNKFEIFIDPRANHYNPNTGEVGLLYWNILKVPNTIFEWSSSKNDSVKYSYNDVYKVASLRFIKAK